MLNLQVTVKNNTQVMSSIDLAKLCVGNSKDAHSNFMKKAKTVLKDVVNFYDIEKDSMNRDRTILLLPEREACLMAMSYSYELQACVYDEWQKLKEEQAPKTQLEVLAGVANGLVLHEKKLSALENQVDTQQQMIEDLKESYSILPSKPANAESITYIRDRINKKHGLPKRIINEVLYSIHYSPKPAGQVRNTNENASNSTYTVWNTSEVTKLFARFVSECQQVTATQAVHPAIDGRFKLINKI